jgi:hypothetical protein
MAYNGEKMLNSSKRKLSYVLLATSISFLLLGSTTLAAIPAYAATGSLHLNVSPKKSQLSVGNDIVLHGQFKTDVGNDIHSVMVTILGASQELEFDKNGNVLVPDTAFGPVTTKLTIQGKKTNDPYEISKQILQFWVPIKKSVLGVGDYTALVEVVTTGGSFEAPEDFKIVDKTNGSGGGSNLSVVTVIVNTSGSSNNVSVVAVVINKGKSNSGIFSVNAFLSNNNLLDGNDVSIGNVNVNSLGGGNTSIVMISGHVAGKLSNSQFLLLNVDGGNSVAEDDENDNVMGKPVLNV